MNDVLEAIAARRSIRKLTSDPVPRSEVEAILEAGRFAPSGKNTQPWRFVVVQSTERREALSKLAPQADMIATAPVTIAVLRDRRAGYDELKDTQGIGAAIQNMLLAAHALGLGACWMGKTREPAIETVIAARDSEELMALIPIGHPVDIPEPPSRHSLKELVRFL
jgi:nitroreductase